MILMFGVSGCATAILPGSTTDLVENSDLVRDYCYQLPREEVDARVGDLLGKCYGEGGTVVPAGARDVPDKDGLRVTRERLPDGNRYSVAKQDGFSFVADVLEGDEYCETRVHLYAVTASWEPAFGAVDRAVRSRGTNCP
jgi:hypothetical protein